MNIRKKIYNNKYIINSIYAYFVLIFLLVVVARWSPKGNKDGCTTLLDSKFYSFFYVSRAQQPTSGPGRPHY